MIIAYVCIILIAVVDYMPSWIMYAKQAIAEKGFS